MKTAFSPQVLEANVAALGGLHRQDPKHFFKQDWEFIDLHLSCYESRYPKLDKAIRELQGKCSLPVTKNTREHIKLLLLNLLQSLRAEYPYALAYPASFKAVKKLSAKADSSTLSTSTGDVADGLAVHGYATKLSGSNFFGTKKGIEGGGRKYNRLLPTQKLVDEILVAYDLANLPLKHNASASFITVTHKRNLDDYTEIKDDIPLKTFTAPEDKAAIKAANKILLAYNKLLSRTSITLAQGQLEETASKKVYQRFCRGSLEYGGRLYGGFWQGLPSGKRGQVPSRKDILIDGEPTVELDYKALHVNMLLAWQGKQPLNGDPYAVPGWDRDLVKRCILVALNARTGSARAIQDEIAVDEDLKQFYPLLLKGGYAKLRDAFLQMHPSLEQYLHADVGVKLQKQDGQIAMLVIQRMMNLPSFIYPEPIPVLSIHDSFICQQRHAQTLQLCMEGLFQNVMKTKERPLVERVG